MGFNAAVKVKCEQIDRQIDGKIERWTETRYPNTPCCKIENYNMLNLYLIFDKNAPISLQLL